MNFPKVSVVMPAFNSSKYILDAINSVVGQSYTNWELIIVDDCSTDNTSELVNCFMLKDKRIRLIRLERNYGGPAGPRNIGIRAAKGTLIAFLDSDDLWHPKKLEIQIDAMLTTGTTFCSSSMRDIIDGDNFEFAPIVEKKFKFISFLNQLISSKIPTSSVLVNKDLVMKHPFNESISYKAREDLDCWLNCLEEINFSVKVLIPLVGYRLISGQISQNKLKMIFRQFHVLSRYKLKNGRQLTKVEAIFFTLTHFSISIYNRKIRGVL